MLHEAHFLIAALWNGCCGLFQKKMLKVNFVILILGEMMKW